MFGLEHNYFELEFLRPFTDRKTRAVEAKPRGKSMMVTECSARKSSPCSNLWSEGRTDT